MAKKYGTKTSADVKRILKEIGKHVVVAAENVIKENADMLVEEMKRRVPVSSGNLRNSIHAERQRDDKDGFVQYRVVVDAQNEKGFKYAKIVEFSPKIQKPYMYPSFDALRGGMKENVIRKIQEAVHAK